jgi:hypothetical protein
MKTLFSLALAASCLVLSATAGVFTPASPDAESKAEEKMGDDKVLLPESGSTMNQQRMEEDRNDGRSRDAKKRATQDINLYDQRPSRKPQ